MFHFYFTLFDKKEYEILENIIDFINQLVILEIKINP